jgi:hypothetical protein
MQARATAIDRLVRDGDLETISFEGDSDAIDADVERQLDALKQLDR